MYEGIPHLLTPVITDPKKATNALRNAVLEMERRLKLLAGQGVRNIDQYNKKVRPLASEPRSLFEEDEPLAEDLKPLPFILIVIDELADLMMLERGNVEEAVARLAQMARAVGMHLVLATQRPSVDVITGLIKANFPSRISFRVATRVDSRTVLDVMGAEHLLGKGDMLFLPPGSSRLTRVHGAFVTEAEINRVVECWKAQARPDYDQTFLLAPPADDEDPEGAEFEGGDDPAYQDAVRVVLEMGKASTSTLQRRLRLGYGRAARILDMMQHEGIIGPPDGSKPREVLKRPDWLEEVEKPVALASRDSVAVTRPPMHRILRHHDPRDDVGDQAEARQRKHGEHHPEHSHQRHVESEVARESGANARDLGLAHRTAERAVGRFQATGPAPPRRGASASGAKPVLFSKLRSAPGAKHRGSPLFHSYAPDCGLCSAERSYPKSPVCARPWPTADCPRVRGTFGTRAARTGSLPSCPRRFRIPPW